MLAPPPVLDPVLDRLVTALTEGIDEGIALAQREAWPELDVHCSRQQALVARLVAIRAADAAPPPRPSTETNLIAALGERLGQLLGLVAAGQLELAAERDALRQLAGRLPHVRRAYAPGHAPRATLRTG